MGKRSAKGRDGDNSYMVPLENWCIKKYRFKKINNLIDIL